MSHLVLHCAAFALTRFLVLGAAPLPVPTRPVPFPGVHPWERSDELKVELGEEQGRVAILGKDRLAIVSRSAVVHVYVTPRTQLVRDGKTVPFSELAAGDRVRATFDVRGNTNVARKIEILARPEKMPVKPGGR